MPLGLQQAREMRTLYDTPVLATIPPNSGLSTAYEIFATAVPSTWKSVSDVMRSDDNLLIRDEGKEIRLKSSRHSS
jgi:hypothetical protein